MSSVLDRTVLKEGQLYLVADHAGDISSLNGDGHGLYYRDTRHLSLFEMELSGTRLALLSSAGELNFMSNLQLANETLVDEDGVVVAPARSISIRRNRFLLDGLHERLGFLNYNPAPGLGGRARDRGLRFPRHVRRARLPPAQHRAARRAAPDWDRRRRPAPGYRGSDGVAAPHARALRADARPASRSSTISSRARPARSPAPTRTTRAPIASSCHPSRRRSSSSPCRPWRRDRSP